MFTGTKGLAGRIGIFIKGSATLHFLIKLFLRPLFASIWCKRQLLLDVELEQVVAHGALRLVLTFLD